VIDELNQTKEVSILIVQLKSVAPLGIIAVDKLAHLLRHYVGNGNRLPPPWFPWMTVLENNKSKLNKINAEYMLLELKESISLCWVL